MALALDRDEAEPPLETPPPESDPLAPLERLSTDSNVILAMLFNPHADLSSRESELMRGRPRMTRLLGIFRNRKRPDHKMRCNRIAGIYLERELAECLENILVHVRSEVRVAVSLQAPVVIRSAGLDAEMCQRVQALTNAHLAEVCAANQRRAPEMVTERTEAVPQGEEVGHGETAAEPPDKVSVTLS